MSAKRKQYVHGLQRVRRRWNQTRRAERRAAQRVALIWLEG